MKFVLITNDLGVVEEAKSGFHPADMLDIYADWGKALDNAGDADMILVDMLATLTEPHKVEGYEKFAEAKMSHPIAHKVPLVLIGPDPDYKMDFVVGYPDFLIGHLQRPVDYRQFRRASTWV